MSFDKLRFDDGPYPRARLGFVAVANAGLTEGDMFAMCPPGVGLSFTRVRMQTACTVASLSGMERDLGDALATLSPGRQDLDVLCYNCTAGSFVIGEDKIIAMIEATRPQGRATTLLSGVHAALRAVGARRVAMATAYTDDINELEKAHFTRQGFDVVNLAGLGLLTDVEMNRVSPDCLMDFARHVDRPEADALFISCGALRSTGIVETLERELGKPVIGSNQASMWNCLRLAGIRDRMAGFGSLLRDH
ncbi:arylmalonate decarboxylase [Bosea sp. (in: a-proteobacteria)]|uniref:maleate cis-trans isomerase family protein n=1 Tax=Bosea sp. (in: a-proteobacteria) TaxID=1871050 RepID=UPI00260D361E|nr:arylmalonate decarboxylase [Bosea sp. (in: a-proteobacteria)]MCO5089950.1 arylmalonate decarboxylase [Bosea sp. (in: a-proteobacteria)]